MNPADSPETQSTERRIPAIPAVVVFAIGVVADSCAQVSGWTWVLVAAFALCMAAIAVGFRHSRVMSACLLIAVVGTGAARHHSVWFGAHENNIGLFATDKPQPARLIGTICSRPLLMLEDARETGRRWGSRERTVLVVDAQQLQDGERWREVSGSVRVDIVGLVSNLWVGDEVELTGRMLRPEELRNVGEFDIAGHLRRDGIRGVLRCRSLNSVKLRQRPNDVVSRFQRGLMMAREHCESVLKNSLAPDISPVATALLLGSRGQMSQQQYDSFIESGTMHVLAISGLNVAILALFVGGVCRLMNLQRLATGVWILLIVGGYAAITEAGPPVVRASLLVFLAAIGWPWNRPPHSANLLALTGLGVLLWSPTDLFDAGAQLSFLAVAVILWKASRSRQSANDTTSVGGVTPIADSSPESIEQELAAKLTARLPKSAWQRCRSTAWNITRESFEMSSWIWLFTAPATAFRFHLVSPIGLLANIPLLPITVATLWFGYALLLVGFVSSSLVMPFALLCEWGLRLMLIVVNLAAQVRHGHAYIPSPPSWWLLGMAIIGSGLLIWNQIPLRRHWAWKSLWGWTALGLAVALWPRQPGPLRCTFLSVGHGLSVLIETPQGRTLLYDNGMMGNSRRPMQIARHALWHQGHRGLDAILLSHADADHINGIPGLLRSISVGQVFASPQFLDRSQPAVRELLQSLEDNHVPMKLLWQGDSLPLENGLSLRILHPDATTQLMPDNANSIVLLIEFAGRRILLTGDLEGPGLRALLQQPPIPTDVLLAPHHGSRTANTTDLARWACPQFVVASQDVRGNIAALRTRYDPASVVLSTSQFGAITFEIDVQGELTWASFRKTPNSSLNSVSDEAVP